ncbi:Receptor-type guanylate cyclase gcy [Seminavis robusta]|uniref:Receptor-type guanylate cyclase gcy n=1 Tax=Seminavis robusta TaxID=568900 RepID=A0A9N8ESW1_9STRA|nr:Receptor-type guanylate cyclase gcy [Seminavis robusta]|eukprot:Sro1588_g284290.1 Receptor-type guanylate cyclase gcy (1190) ;mRNA; r:10415-15813
MARPKDKSIMTASGISTIATGDSYYDVSDSSMDMSTLFPVRDEVKEIEKSSQVDTANVRLWRLATTGALLLTAFLVTYATYRFLKNEERNNFETAFEQFSRTIAVSAIAQQSDLRDGMETLATTISLYAKNNNANTTWPFITVPDFEHHGRNMIQQSRVEVVNLFTRVAAADQHEYIAYANQHARQWVEEGHQIQKGSLERLLDPLGNMTYHPFFTKVVPMDNTPLGMGFAQDTGTGDENEYFSASWQFSPPPATYALINWNANSHPDYEMLGHAILALRYETVATRVRPYFSVPLTMTEEEHVAYHSKLQESSHLTPHTFIGRAIFRTVNDYESDIVATLGVGMAWDAALNGLLPANVDGIQCVVKNTCNQTFTYEIWGEDAIFRGEEDLHLAKYDDMKVTVDLALHTHPDFETTPGHCMYWMDIYPTDKFKSAYDSNTPEIFAAVVAATFGIVAVVFFIYDTFVQKRNTNLVLKAAQTSSIVTNVFPEHMRDRLLHHAAEEKTMMGKRASLKTYLTSDGKMGGEMDLSEPLADLYLECTVLYADITGFTAWSSTRDPTQVFQLLETIYSAFDSLGKKHRHVFKVESTGDIYTAVVGIPNPVPNHAIVMVKYARAIISKMHSLTKVLEKRLGPDTADLSLRVGINSGPVTAGVLRGKRNNFSVFGDTVNIAARMESSGKPGRIHLSKETADLIEASGHENWLEKRRDLVNIQGKGVLETYWLSLHRERTESCTSVDSFSDLIASTSYGARLPGLDEKTYRLIDWNVETLLRLVREMVAFRGTNAASLRRRSTTAGLFEIKTSDTPLTEVREIIQLPEFKLRSKTNQNPDKVELPAVVVEQLHHLVSTIASKYHDNPFHNFQHASHVVMGCMKLIGRIVSPSEDFNDSANAAASLYENTYGITDPLTQFACAFSCLIHDVDHVGVSNAQLVKENVPVAARYNGRSVAEQNSLDLSWDLLMQDRYGELRAFLFPKTSHLERFRQLVVNSVMATDIVDKELKALRNRRWEKAFKKNDAAVNSSTPEEHVRDTVNRKATIVIEHIIQAADISHTMQHWQVYRKWNQNLFEELYVAYLNGRMDKDPSTFWYNGEFGFFDFYIIPLTRKLKECGVFGVSSDEYLNYALKNRLEWETKGQQAVTEMLEVCAAKYGTKEDNKLMDKALLYPRRGSAETASQAEETFMNEDVEEIEV